MSTINRINYEAYALEYLEGTLSAEMQREMQAFLVANPDIQAELDEMELLYFPADPDIAFPDKGRLRHPENKPSRKPLFLWVFVGLGVLSALLLAWFVQPESADGPPPPQPPKPSVVTPNPLIAEEGAAPEKADGFPLSGKKEEARTALAEKRPPKQTPKASSEAERKGRRRNGQTANRPPSDALAGHAPKAKRPSPHPKRRPGVQPVPPSETATAIAARPQAEKTLPKTTAPIKTTEPHKEAEKPLAEQEERPALASLQPLAPPVILLQRKPSPRLQPLPASEVVVGRRESQVRAALAPPSFEGWSLVPEKRSSSAESLKEMLTPSVFTSR